MSSRRETEPGGEACRVESSRVACEMIKLAGRVRDREPQLSLDDETRSLTLPRFLRACAMCNARPGNSPRFFRAAVKLRDEATRREPFRGASRRRGISNSNFTGSLARSRERRCIIFFHAMFHTFLILTLHRCRTSSRTKSRGRCENETAFYRVACTRFFVETHLAFGIRRQIQR